MMVMAALASALVLGRPAPDFRLPDVAGHIHTLHEWRGQPVVLYFYCGCQACHNSARLWAQMAAGETAGPHTVIVFSGDAAEARLFDAQTGVDSAHVVTLADPQDIVTNRYGVTVCPRVFVLDAQGRLRDTNDQPGTNPQTTPAIALDSEALTAWRKASAPAARTAAPPQFTFPRKSRSLGRNIRSVPRIARHA